MTNVQEPYLKDCKDNPWECDESAWKHNQDLCKHHGHPMRLKASGTTMQHKKMKKWDKGTMYNWQWSENKQMRGDKVDRQEQEQTSHWVASVMDPRSGLQLMDNVWWPRQRQGDDFEPGGVKEETTYNTRWASAEEVRWSKKGKRCQNKRQHPIAPMTKCMVR